MDDLHHLLVEYKSSFYSLPNHIILKIFSYLDKKYYCDVALVCKHFVWLVSDPILWKYVDVQESNISVTQLEYLLRNRYFSLVCNLNASGCVLNPQTITSIAKRCPQLKNLLLKNCQLSSSNELVFESVQNEPELEPIVFSKDMIRLDIRNFGDGFLLLHSILMQSSCEQLECFGFGHSSTSFDCPQFNGFNNFISRLKNLRVLECCNVNLINDETIEIISNYLSNLEYLGLRKCALVKGRTLGSLVKNCKKLTSLILSATSIDDQSLLSVDWSNTSIEELDIGDCEKITSFGLSYLLRNISNVKYLILDKCGRCKAFSDDVAELCCTLDVFSKVKILSLSNSLQLSTGFMSLCTTKIGDGSFRFLQLQELSLRSCGLISPSMFTKEILSTMPLIKFIEVGTMVGELEPFAGKIPPMTQFNYASDDADNITTETSRLNALAIYNNLLSLDLLRVGGAIHFLYNISVCNPLIEKINIATRYITNGSYPLIPEISKNRDEPGCVFRSIINVFSKCYKLRKIDLPHADLKTIKIYDYAIDCRMESCNQRETNCNLKELQNSPSGISLPRKSLDSELTRIPFKSESNSDT